jgi:hypothetical protein
VAARVASWGDRRVGARWGAERYSDRSQMLDAFEGFHQFILSDLVSKVAGKER